MRTYFQVMHKRFRKINEKNGENVKFNYIHQKNYEKTADSTIRSIKGLNQFIVN